MPVSTTVSCPTADTLRDLLLGHVRGPEAESLEVHVSGCAECAERLEDLSAEDELVELFRRRSAILDTIQPEQIETFLSAIRARCPEQTPEAISEFLDPGVGNDELGRVGAYRVLREIGRGGMGVVFEAEDTLLRRIVALKFLNEMRAGMPDYLARFDREAEVLARLQHSNIVPVYEAGRHRGRPYLVLEYIGGGTLATYLQGRPQPPREAAFLVRTLAEAVHYAHEQGVVHRDLKPSNVLLRVDPMAAPQSRLVPRIVDFGLARHLDDEAFTHTTDLLGTPGYMPPEMTRGGQTGVKDSPAIDVYSLGAILYECLTGRPPFRGETVPDTLEQVRQLDPVPPRRLQPKSPKDLETICLKCLAKEPSNRYLSARDLAEDLQRFYDGRPILARPTSLLEGLVKWTRRKPAWATLLAVTLVATMALAVVAVRYEKRLRRAVDQAEASALEASREREHARANYREARAALEKMLARTSDRRHSDLPRVRELRKEQQEDAIAFYLLIANQSKDPDPEIRWDAAQARFEASLLQINLGRVEEARTNLQRAVEQFRELKAADPDNSRYRRALANTLNRLGAITPNDTGVGILHDALQEIEWLHAREPANQSYRSDIAQICHALGQNCFGARKVDEAEQYYSRSIEVRRELLKERPDWREQQLAIGQTLANLVNVKQVAKRPYTETESIANEASAMLQAASRADPSDPIAIIALTHLRNVWAYSLIARGEAAVAAAELAWPIEKLEEFLAREPNWVEARNILYGAHGTRAIALDGLKKYAEAAKDYRRVVELSPTDQARKNHRVELTALLLQAKDYSVAADEMDRVAADPTPIVDSWHLKEHLRCCAGLSNVGRCGIRPFRDRTVQAAISVLRGVRKPESAEQWNAWLAEARQIPEVAEFLRLPVVRAVLP